MHATLLALGGWAAERKASLTGSFLLDRRRAAARRSASYDLACANGWTSSYDDASKISVDSSYYDAACTALRERTTSGYAIVDPGDHQYFTGVAVLYDRSQNAVDYQTFGYDYFDGIEVMQSTDARTSGGTPFSTSSMSCYSGPASPLLRCPIASVEAGSNFDTGVHATIGYTPPNLASTYSVQVTPYVGAPGTLSIDTRGILEPAVAGGTALAPLAGTLTLTVASAQPCDVSALSLSLSGTGEQITGSLGNGAITVQDGSATATLDLNGNGTIRYANGFVEHLIHYRDVG